MDRINQSYLIRCWQVNDVKPQSESWRFSIESADGQGERQGFTDPEQLLANLLKRVEQKAKSNK